jgi:MFS family permease
VNSQQVAGLAFFLPTIVSTIYPQATVIEKQLYTVPPYIAGAVFTVLIPYLSTRFNTRVPIMIGSAPFMMFGYILFLASTNPQVRYAATFFVTSSAFAFGALCPAHAAANVDSDSARASAIGLVVMLGSCGALISTWSFLPWDAPNYFIGNGLNLATTTVIFISGVCMLLWMRSDNRRRDRVEAEEMMKLSDEEKLSLECLEWRHPQWRWRI